MAQYNENELNELAHGALVAVEGLVAFAHAKGRVDAFDEAYVNAPAGAAASI